MISLVRAEKQRQLTRLDLLALGITERDDMHPGFWRAMGRIKGEHKRVSLADCAALALAADLDASLMTADRHELEPLLSQGICKIEFIR